MTDATSLIRDSFPRAVLLMSGGLLIAATGCSQSCPQPVSQVGPVVADALAGAHRAYKPLLVTTTSRWCEPCKQFMVDSGGSPVLAQAVSAFELITLDSVADEADCRALEIEIYPTFVMLSPGGHLLARWYGYGPAPRATAERIVEALFQAGRSFELAGKGQHAYCLYQWTVQAGEPGPLVTAARKSAAQLVQEGRAESGARAIWEPVPQLAAGPNHPQGVASEAPRSTCR